MSISYIDAFCGRVPKSVLARHHGDFNTEELKEISDEANLKVLTQIDELGVIHLMMH